MISPASSSAVCNSKLLYFHPISVFETSGGGEAFYTNGLELRVIGMLDCFAPTSEYHQSQINGCNYLIFVFGVLEQRQIATVASLPRDDDVAEGIVDGGLEARRGHILFMCVVLPSSPYEKCRVDGVSRSTKYAT